MEQHVPPPLCLHFWTYLKDSDKQFVSVQITIVQFTVYTRKTPFFY